MVFDTFVDVINNDVLSKCFMILGLYSKAIAMSGTNLAPWSQPAHKGVATKRALQLAEHFNCHKPNDWTQTLDCLRNIPATNLTASFYDFYVIFSFQKNSLT